MKLDGEHRIVRAMNSMMRAHGWSLLALCELPLCYSKNLAVTPYFLCSEISLQPDGKYAITGSIGVIHQEFEKLWVQKAERQPKSPGFGVILDLLNLRELRQKRYVAAGAELEAQVNEFCTVVVDYLARMPHDERGLISAFENNELCGLPLKAFSGYAYRSKFTAFWEFVSQLRSL